MTSVQARQEFAAGLSTGQWGSFNVKLNRDMMPNVTEVALVDEDWKPNPGDLSESKEAEDVPPSWESSGVPQSSLRAQTARKQSDFSRQFMETYEN